MSAPEFERVLTEHAQVKGWPIVECRCGWCADHGQDYTAHRAHLAAALAAEVARWLADEGMPGRVADALVDYETEVVGPGGYLDDTSPMGYARAALAALAALAATDTTADEKGAGR